MSHERSDPLNPASSAGVKDGDIFWVILARVYPPDDIIIESLLRSQNIPYRIKRHGIPQFPVAAGPFAETVITVPEGWEAEARQLLEPCPDSQPGDNNTL